MARTLYLLYSDSLLHSSPVLELSSVLSEGFEFMSLSEIRDPKLILATVCEFNQIGREAFSAKYRVNWSQGFAGGTTA